MDCSYRLAAPAFICMGLASASGCATTAELEALRAEVEEARSTAANVAADNEKMRYEISALRAEVDSTTALSSRQGSSSGSSNPKKGDKWRKLEVSDSGP